MIHELFQEYDKVVISLIALLIGWILNSISTYTKNRTEKTAIRNRNIAVLYEIRYHLKKYNKFAHYLDIFIQRYLSKIQLSELEVSNLELNSIIHHFMSMIKPSKLPKNFIQIKELLNSHISELISIHPILGYELMGMENKLLVESEVENIITKYIKDFKIKVNADQTKEINKIKLKIKDYLVEDGKKLVEEYILKLACKNSIFSYFENYYYINSTNKINLKNIEKEIDNYITQITKKID